MADPVLDEYRRRLMARYRRQVGEYAEHLALLDDRAVRAPLKPGEWSAHQVLFHTASVDEQAYGPRLRLILRADHPVLEDFDSDRWMLEHYDAAQPTQDLLQGWAAAREAYAVEAEAAPPEAWSRSGRQTYWGERTLQWWIERAVAHADDHWRQLLGE
jgi:hypothetical protein